MDWPWLRPPASLLLRLYGCPHGCLHGHRLTPNVHTGVRTLRSLSNDNGIDASAETPSTRAQQTVINNHTAYAPYGVRLEDDNWPHSYRVRLEIIRPGLSRMIVMPPVPKPPSYRRSRQIMWLLPIYSKLLGLLVTSTTCTCMVWMFERK